VWQVLVRILIAEVGRLAARRILERLVDEGAPATVLVDCARQCHDDYDCDELGIDTEYDYD
jgi:hypothetical protein